MTFEQIQAEEALHLAYVALTRARDRCYWIAEPKPNGALSRLEYEPEYIQTNRAE